MKKKIGLLATARKKAHGPAPVTDFYKSPLFIKSLRYARQTYDRFYFYNARDGLLLPDKIMEPYDISIRTFPQYQKVAWGKRVIAMLNDLENLKSVSLYLHGGRIYRNYLEPELNRLGIDFIVPLEGMSIGKQLRWYDEHTLLPED
ncbi:MULTISPECIES: DUF6884 domain-containing protein [unclassified Sporolactobacillus]|uniref:DUF6884 domain-containing protein n=1 Tax=unclassified Sporolactobacillus TaxID=2628533 RepID=UPI0023684934|nr:DUF6884 domain-containing protein [Sporolactobacillus sp. CQH2019]MDD9149479.1 hypothetical protein [Sporolactobacillus sp. CQH2019]